MPPACFVQIYKRHPSQSERALYLLYFIKYNNYLTVHTQIRKKNYIVHFVTINIEEEKKLKTTAIYSLYNLYNY